MRNVVVTIKDIIELNHTLMEKNMNFKVHLHDACGKQNFSMEPLGINILETERVEMKSEITQYFEEKGIQVRFLDNQNDFILY